jgi:NitT/TauT family transport system permease protein
VKYYPSVLVVVVALAIWEIASVIFAIPSFILPAPTSILMTLFTRNINWLPHIAVTLYEIMGGFILSVIVGIPLSFAIAYSDWLNRAIYPLILAIQVVPKVALAPILFIIIGFGDTPRILVVLLTAFFPIIINTVAGLNSLDPDFVELLRSEGATKSQVFVWGRFPNALPSIFSGLKVAITLAVVGAVVAEFVASSAGLGYILLQALYQLGTVTAFIALLWLTIMGYGVFVLLEAFERATIPWYIKSKQARA